MAVVCQRGAPAALPRDKPTYTHSRFKLGPNLFVTDLNDVLLKYK